MHQKPMFGGMISNLFGGLLVKSGVIERAKRKKSNEERNQGRKEGRKQEGRRKERRNE